MQHEAARRRLVVVRRHSQQRIGAQQLGLTRVRDRGARVIRADAHHQRNAPKQLQARLRHQLAPLFGRESCCFACGSAHDDAVGALFHVPLKQALERHPIDRTATHRRDQRD